MSCILSLSMDSLNSVQPIYLTSPNPRLYDMHGKRSVNYACVRSSTTFRYTCTREETLHNDLAVRTQIVALLWILVEEHPI
jgi:hypothetical protein